MFGVRYFLRAYGSAKEGRNEKKYPNRYKKEVSRVARFLNLWRMNPVAPWPTDSSKYLELEERMWAWIDALMKKGEIEEFGVFPDGTSGYVIGKGDTADLYRDVSMFQPYILSDVHEIIPYEKHKEIIRGVLKTAIAAAHK